MANFKYTNIFNKCTIEELENLYKESKLYNHFAEIPETSPLYKYMQEFLKVSEYRTIAPFYLDLTRALIDKK